MKNKNEDKVVIRTKARSDSILDGLPGHQQASVQQWLFAENRSHLEVAGLCQKEFGVSITRSSVGRYDQRQRPQWDLRQKTRELASDSSLNPADAEGQYRALLARMIQVALDTANSAEDPAERRVVTDFAKVLISARRESHEALRAATTREKFEFDAATACLIHQVKTQSIAADESLDDGQRIQKIREELFGQSLPA